MQYVGLALLFAIYLIQGLKFLLYDMPRDKARTKLKIAEIERVDKATREGAKIVV